MDAKQIEYFTNRLAKVNKWLSECDNTEDAFYSFLIKEKSHIEQKFNNHNVSIRNETNIKEFAKKIIKKEHNIKKKYKKFIDSESINALITSPTQVGKTGATKDFIEVCLDANLPVIVSCDNKSDQLEQFYSRISNEFDSRNVTLVKASDPKLGKIIKECFENNKNFIIFCLDNASQIKKVKEQIVLMIDLEDVNIKKIVVAHDEGDVITKDYNIEDIEKDQSESHKEWLKMSKYFSRKQVELKRVFVTATPENIVYKYKVEHVIRLSVPNNYIGYEKIKYTDLDPKNIKDILIEEQNRRILQKENGAILYCIDRKIMDGQDPTFRSVCSYLDCVVNTYNGNGIIARVNNEKFEKRLEKFASINNKIKGNKKIFTRTKVQIRIRMCGVLKVCQLEIFTKFVKKLVQVLL